VAQRLYFLFESLLIKSYKIYFMPTTNTRSTKTKRSSSTRQSRAKASRNVAKSTTKKTSNPEMSESNGHSQLEKLFTDTLKDIYWAEKQLTKALPKMQKKATTDDLKSAIEEHLAQTEEHVSRLEQVFDMCGKKAQAKKCEAMAGLIEEGNSVVEETENGSMTRDAGIIMAAQKVEHYEIATYGCLVTFAKTLGMEDAAELLGQTLEEEKETDEKLTQIAEGNINQSAEQETDEESEDEDEDNEVDEEKEEEEEEEKEEEE
jgi:ferritin-like metal-binding protein YciE